MTTRSAAQSPVHTSCQEYLVKWNELRLHFLKNPLFPIGADSPPGARGANMELDPDKIDQEEEIRL